MVGKFENVTRILSRVSIFLSIIACSIKDIVLMVVFGPINIIYLCVLLSAAIGLYTNLSSRNLKISLAVPLSMLNFYAPVPNYVSLPWENYDIMKDRDFLFYLNGDYYIIPIILYYFTFHVIIILCLDKLKKYDRNGNSKHRS